MNAKLSWVIQVKVAFECQENAFSYNAIVIAVSTTAILRQLHIATEYIFACICSGLKVLFCVDNTKYFSKEF